MLPMHSSGKEDSCNFIFFNYVRKAFARESKRLNYLNNNLFQFSIFN